MPTKSVHSGQCQFEALRVPSPTAKRFLQLLVGQSGLALEVVKHT